MTHPQLRLAAAKFALNVATETDIVDASHAALDDALYADGLAVVATLWDPSLSELRPHFAAALRELDHAFTSQDDALRSLRLSYLGQFAEQPSWPADTLGQYHRFHVHLQCGSLVELGAWSTPSMGELMAHCDEGESLLNGSEIEGGSLMFGMWVSEWNRKAARLCREWCREYARLYLQPAWRSPTVLALASAIHAENAFDRLPVLADALEEAGCDHPDLLGHCRHDTPHTDYCWLVDALNGVTRQGEPGV